MIYPLNIFTPDPASGSVRPFVLFLAYKPEFSLHKDENYALSFNKFSPRGGFVLPMPNGGLLDGVSHSYTQDNPFMNMITDPISGTVADGFSMVLGTVVDPLVTQIYKGTSPRSWSGTWQLIPQSLAESIAIALILRSIKIYASPDKRDLSSGNKIGVLIQPLVFDIYFGNPYIQASMNFNKMAIESYSINYFAQGYASTYKDLMPKHIELTMTFREFGIKYRSDWGAGSIVGSLTDPLTDFLF